MATNYLRPFVVRAPGTFETRLRDVEARLEIVATVQFPSLDHMTALLSARPDIGAAMAEAIDSVVRAWMHSIDPERFYMRIGFTNEREAQSAETELTQLITDRLSGDPFYAQVLNVVLKLVDTDLIHRFRELQKTVASFSVTVELSDVEPMEFQGDLRVVTMHPDGWPTFRTLTEGIEQITARIRDQVLAFLRTRPVEELRYCAEVERAALEAHVSAEVARYASEQFGLVVRVSSFRRTSTVFERLPRELRQEQMLRISDPVMVPDERRLLARVERLIEQRNALLAADVGELRTVEKEIAALRRHLHEARDHAVGKVPLESNTPTLVSPSSDKAETASHDVSAFDIALSMDLEGPPDWSERIDHYLYGVDDGK